MATGVGGRKCDWQHSMAYPRKSHYRRKNLADIFYTSRVITNFVPNFVGMTRGVGQGKMQLAAFDGPSPNPSPYRPRCKNLAKISYASRIIANFVSNFVAMATGVGWWKMQLAAFDDPSRKPHIGAKISQKISYASQVIANFVPNFVAMATGVNQGKMQLASFNGPSPKKPL